MATLLKKKRYIVGACITAVILAVAMAPFLLSTSAALNFVLSRINNRIPGSVSVESWIIGWQQGVFCQQVTYHAPDKGVRITLPRFTSTRGLLEIILAPRNLGVLVVENPTIELTGAWLEKIADTPGSTAEQALEYSDGTPLWNQIIADLKISDGVLKAGQVTTGNVVGLKGINVDADLYGGVVNFDLDFHALREQGTVKAKGSLNFPARHHAWLDTLITDLELSVISLELHDFLVSAAEHTSLPAGEGIVNADIRVKAVGTEDLQLSGIVDIRGLKLGGGLLGEDTPSFQNIHLTVDDARWSGKEWLIDKLDLTSDTAVLQGSGRYGSDGIQMAGKGSVNLPVLFDQFPRLLGLREAAFIESGTVSAEGDFKRSGSEGSIRFKAAIDDLGGLHDGRKFAWSAPVTMIMNGSAHAGDIQVKALRFDAPFAHIEGRGDFDSFIFDATADLQQALTEIGRLFRLDWDGSGKVEMAVKSRAGKPEGGTVTVDTDMTISDFTLNRGADMVVPMHQFSLVGSVEAPQSLWWERSGSLGLQVALSSWLGEIFLVLNGEKSGEKPFRGYYTTDSTFNLDSFTGLLQAFERMPESISMAGDLQIQSAGYLGENGVDIREFDGEIGGFVLVRQGAIFEDQKVRFEAYHSVNKEVESFIIRDLVVVADRDSFFRTGGGLNRITLSDHSIYLNDLRFSSVRTGKIKLDALHVPDWQKPLDDLGVELNGTVNMDQFSGLLRGTGLLPLSLDMSGKGSLALSTGDGRNGSGDISADMQLADFSLMRKQRKVFVEEDVVFRAELKKSEDGSSDISDLRFDFSALQLSANGGVNRNAGQQVVELKGEFTPDLEKVAAILGSGFGMDIEMAGKPTVPFSLTFPVTGTEKPGSGSVTMSAGLSAEMIRNYGMELREVSLPLSFAGNILHAELSAQLNEGTVSLVTETDQASSPPVMHVRGGQQVLTGVQLGKPLVDKLLSSVHPLFGVIADPAGHLSVRVDSLAWPLEVGAGKEVLFASVLDIQDVALQSKGVLKKVLDRFGLVHEELVVRDKEMSCTGRAGRITCSPVRIGSGASEMVVSGSVGMDNTLDYLLDIPVTRKLVGEKMYDDLKGERIIVPLTGTTQQPLVDNKVISSAVDILVQQLAAKATEEQ